MRSIWVSAALYVQYGMFIRERQLDLETSLPEKKSHRDRAAVPRHRACVLAMLISCFFGIILDHFSDKQYSCSTTWPCESFSVSMPCSGWLMLMLLFIDWWFPCPAESCGERSADCHEFFVLDASSPRLGRSGRCADAPGLPPLL